MRADHTWQPAGASRVTDDFLLGEVRLEVRCKLDADEPRSNDREAGHVLSKEGKSMQRLEGRSFNAC